MGLRHRVGAVFAQTGRAGWCCAHGRPACRLCRSCRHRRGRHGCCRRCRGRPAGQAGLRIVFIRRGLLLIRRHRFPIGGTGLHAGLGRGRRRGFCCRRNGQKGQRNGNCDCDCAHERNAPVVCLDGAARQAGPISEPKLYNVSKCQVDESGGEMALAAAGNLHAAPDRLSPCFASQPWEWAV